MDKKGTDLFIENRQAVLVEDLADCRWSSYGVRFGNCKEEWLDDDPCTLGLADSEKCGQRVMQLGLKKPLQRENRS